MYIVIYEGVGVELGGNYKGLRTRVDYLNQEQYEELLREAPTNDKVIAEGVNEEEAKDLVEATPLSAIFHAAVDEAFEGNLLDIKMLQLKLANAIMIAVRRGQVI